MARRRMIDPSLWTDEAIAALLPRQQLLYIGLFSNADDEGRLPGSAKAIRLMLPGVYGEVSDAAILTDLRAVMEACGQLLRYDVAGKAYLVFLNYRGWQTINRPQPSKLPPPPAAIHPSAGPTDVNVHVDENNHDGTITDDSMNDHGPLTDDSLLREEKLREEKGREGPARARDATVPPSHPPDRTDVIFDAVVEAWRPGTTWHELTRSERKQVGSCAAELRAVAATPAMVAHARHVYATHPKWRDLTFTPNALRSHWGELIEGYREHAAHRRRSEDDIARLADLGVRRSIPSAGDRRTGAAD